MPGLNPGPASEGQCRQRLHRIFDGRRVNGPDHDFLGISYFSMPRALGRRIDRDAFMAVRRRRQALWRKPGWHDFRSYTRDSGVPMIVFGWPISAAMMIVPEYVQYRLEKLLGIQWHAGVRIFV